MNSLNENKLFHYRFLMFAFFIILTGLNSSPASGQEDEPLNWVTSRAEAIATALSEGKLILLVAGSET